MNDVDAVMQRMRFGRWRLSFVEPEVEAEYRAWQVQSAIPFIRVGMIASIVNWLVLVPVTYFSLSLAQFWVSTPLILGVMMPVLFAGLATTYRRPLIRWVQPATIVANLVAGLLAVSLCFLNVRRPELSTGAVPLVAYFAFTIFRLRPGHAVIAAAPYVLLHLALYGREVSRGTSTPEDMALFSVLPTVAFVSGLLVCAVLDVVTREAFRQGRIIEVQQRTIEGFLKQEISHQVAERSRSLSETLAKVDALPSARLEPGQQFASRYQVLKQLGSGGMGAVFEVERLTDNRRLALKVVTGPVSGHQAARFAREAEIGARLKHPNLVEIVDVGVSPAGAPYLVMELVPGGNLEDRRADFGKSAAWARPVLLQIARGLAALHQAGVVHRDLKPGNVLLSGDVARISDFGISRFNLVDSDVDPLGETSGPVEGLKGNSLTKTGALIGTPLYMAPEAARGAQAIDRPADVFAFGIVAYEVLSGQLPFAAPPVLEVMAGRSLPDPKPLDSTPLGALIVRCLATAPSQRPSIEEVERALA